MSILFLAAARTLAARAVLTVAVWLRLISPSSAVGRNNHSAVGIGDDLYIYGGGNGTTSSPIGTLFAYNVITETWCQLVGSGVKIYHTAVEIDGKMYVFGGNGSPAEVNYGLLEYTPGSI